MKKTLTILLVLALLLVPQTMLAETVDEAQNLNYDYDELTVGSTMPMSGTFFTNLWSNSSSDIDVRDLLHSCNLVEWDVDYEGYTLSTTVVTGEVVTANEAGDHVYNLFLYDDLYFSDGTPITAWDYAFSFLLRIAPQIGELGGRPLEAEYLLGYADYVTGAVPYLAGVRVLDDHQMLITIDHEYLPYFFELGLLDCVPYPISVIAPGNQVLDDGEGVYLSQPLDAEALKQTILDPDSGYLTHPSVVSGPYQLLSYDGATATFERNPYYKGNALGKKPVIERIVYKTADQATMIDDLLSGQYGLLNRVSSAAAIAKAQEEIEQNNQFGFTSYQRSGLSFISFNTEKAAVSSAAVRQAIAYCLDKDGLTADYTGSFGLSVAGYYGMGQWMYKMLTGVTPYPGKEDGTLTADEEKEWDDLAQAFTDMYDYGQDLRTAEELLIADGWTLNRDGGEFAAGTDDVRCKRIDGELIALDLKLLHSSSTLIGEALAERLAKPLAEVGIKLTVESADNLLSIYYSQQDRDCDMLFMATNFDLNFDPSVTFEPGGALNFTCIDDAELYELAVDMRRTEPGELLDYCKKWLSFLERFNEVEPLIPVYSNMYYDFFTRTLHDYEITANFTWSRAAVSAYMSDIED